MTERRYRVKSADGVSLSVRENGNENGPALLFIHGFAQSKYCFSKQINGGSLSEFRIISFDLRGHGESDKPTNPGAYTEGRRWSEDVAAVIESADLDQPVVIGWSLGGRVIAQYLADFGDEAIGGINFVASRTVLDPKRPTVGLAGRFFHGAQSADLDTNVVATQALVKACLAVPISPSEFAQMLAYSMVSPFYARGAIQNWTGNFEPALKRISVPCLITHGMRDEVALPLASEITAEFVKHARLSWYDQSGHMPFWEEAERFNAELSAFAMHSTRK